MMDDHEAVRVCATRGCAQVLEDFWKILPAHHLTFLLTTLCCEMTHDMSSSEVVVAALQGVQLLLNNPLSHVALKKLLPRLSNHIYHPVTTVRNVMVSLLMTLHQTSIFKVITELHFYVTWHYAVKLNNLLFLFENIVRTVSLSYTRPVISFLSAQIEIFKISFSTPDARTSMLI